MIEHLILTKHRAWYKKKMHFGVYTEKGFIDDQGELLAVNPKGVSICTGLTDRRDKLIYTGDIVRDYQGRISVVRFLVKGGLFVKTSERVVNVNFSAPMARKCEIIGNVFQSKIANNILKQMRDVKTHQQPN